MADEYLATARHTPLPWKFDNTSGCKMIKGGKFHDHRQSQYQELASTSGRGTLRDTPDPDAEDRANAALMAAAPRLWHMTRLLASYSCAESSDDDKPCECGPCDARRLLLEIEQHAKQKSK